MRCVLLTTALLIAGCIEPGIPELDPSVLACGSDSGVVCPTGDADLVAIATSGPCPPGHGLTVQRDNPGVVLALCESDAGPFIRGFTREDDPQYLLYTGGDGALIECVSGNLIAAYPLVEDRQGVLHHAGMTIDRECIESTECRRLDLCTVPEERAGQ